MQAFRKQIASSFRLPEVDETTTGTVVAKFVVGLDGAISDIVILKESPTGLGLGKEATRILSRSPKWTPGVYNGRNVKQYYTLPISIQITANE
jgi:protein TonB